MAIQLFKKPTAWIPILMSLAAIGMIVSHFAMQGIVHEADEGTAAHLFQLLMVAQVPLVVAFAAIWLPRERIQALKVVALQAALVIVAVALVYFLT
jgi:hypothetical protein